MTMHNVAELVKLLNKNQNHYYYNVISAKYSHQLTKKY